MIKFWDKIAEGLAAGWLGKFLLRPAVFLGIGFLAYLWHFGFEFIPAVDRAGQLHR